VLYFMAKLSGIVVYIMWFSWVAIFESQTVLSLTAMQELHSFVTSAMDTGEMSNSRTCLFAPAKELRGPFGGTLGGPENRSVSLAGIRTKIFRPLT
jgi:hypothetical protein